VPALVIIGAVMMQNVTRIDWRDYTESLPAFLLSSIADDLAIRFITYPSSNFAADLDANSAG